MNATRRPEKPVLAFTSGDPAGIGPEIVIAAARSGRLDGFCRPLLIGERSVWRRAGWSAGLAPLLDTGLALRPPAFGRPSRMSGLASFEAVRQATRLAARGLVSAIVTAPISKRAWNLAEIPFADHTEFFGALAQHPVDMILGSQEKEIWCCLATRHVALRRVAGSLSIGGVVSAASSLNAALRRLGLRRPRLGLCALNPHAGEDGLLGAEEKKILLPAVAVARRRGIDLVGPLPADTAWRWHMEGLVGGLVALYHDQALVPIKAVCGLSAVNWTAGLPFVRTSPAHGTGFDIAGRKKADFSATLAAARLAARLLKNGKSRR